MEFIEFLLIFDLKDYLVILLLVNDYIIIEFFYVDYSDVNVFWWNCSVSIMEIILSMYDYIWNKNKIKKDGRLREKN